MHYLYLPYQDEDTDLEAFVAYPKEEKQYPLVMLCHSWSGRDKFVCEKAKYMADLGYVGFALDMYGKGILGHSLEENAALKKPFIENRYLLRRRINQAFNVARALPYVDTNKIAVLGFGFGAICALDLVRSGVNIKGAISVYGHFDPPPAELIKVIQAKILVLHGYCDPISPKEELLQFGEEMHQAQVDWQMHLYGDAMHAFTTDKANNPDMGILYNPTATRRAWQAINNFLSEVLS